MLKKIYFWTIPVSVHLVFSLCSDVTNDTCCNGICLIIVSSVLHFTWYFFTYCGRNKNVMMSIWWDHIFYFLELQPVSGIIVKSKTCLSLFDKHKANTSANNIPLMLSLSQRSISLPQCALTVLYQAWSVSSLTIVFEEKITDELHLFHFLFDWAVAILWQIYSSLEMFFSKSQEIGSKFPCKVDHSF